MKLSHTWRHGRCLMLCFVTVFSIAGCETLGKKLAGIPAGVESHSAYEVRRINPKGWNSPVSKEGKQDKSQEVELADGHQQESELSVLHAQNSESTNPPQVQTVQFREKKSPDFPSPLPPPSESSASEDIERDSLPVGTSETPAEFEGSFPIDLPTALGLAGANNLQIAFAAERVQEAIAQTDAADVLWVPSLRGGLVYNNHNGQLQATEGQVIDVNRSSLFVGGGAGVANAPLNGGSGGPARMFVDLSPVDVLFEPLAARQIVQAREATQTATFNNTLLQAASAYLNLLRAHALVAISREAVSNAEELARLTEDFARQGRGLEADAERARAELQSRKRELLAAQEQAAVVSAELTRLLRLDPATTLVPAQAKPIPLHLIEQEVQVQRLIAQAQVSRPELASANANVQETWYRMRQEYWRPWVPHLYAGASSGGFGGSAGGDIDNFSDRTDFDVAAIWEVQNLGLGNGARRREQESLHRQAHITMGRIRDLVAAQVTQAHRRVHFRRQQIDTTRSQVGSATEALKLNMDGIRGGVVRPIELQQAIGALAAARQQHLNAVLDYNLAQLELLRAIGRPPGAPSISQ